MTIRPLLSAEEMDKAVAKWPPTATTIGSGLAIAVEVVKEVRAVAGRQRHPAKTVLVLQLAGRAMPARMDAVLNSKEKRADLLREALRQELDQREKLRGRRARAKR